MYLTFVWKKFSFNMYLIQIQASAEIIHGQGGQQIQNSITLLGNLLRIPTALPNGGSKNVSATANREHQLLWNMFSQGLGSVIMSLTLSPHRDHW